MNNQTSSVCSDDKILKQAFRRDNLYNVIEAEHLTVATRVHEVVSEVETLFELITLENLEWSTLVFFGAHHNKLVVINIIVGQVKGILVRERSIISELTYPVEFFQAKILHEPINWHETDFWVVEVEGDCADRIRWDLQVSYSF